MIAGLLTFQNSESNSMKMKIQLKLILCISLLFIQYSTGQDKNFKAEPPLKLITSVILPDVNGRIDHLAYNSKQQLIYIAALGNNTVEVVDVKNAKVVHTIKGLAEPQGIRYIPESHAIVVANGDNGICDVFKADSYLKITSVKLTGDADNVRYDSGAQKIYVGYGSGGIAIIDAKTFKQLADIKLPGHPESFQLDNNLKKLFVNVPDAHNICVIDLVKNSIETEWKTEEATANFPMALDVINHRMFIGCRQPAKLLVISTETGNSIASFDTDGDTDDIFYDTSGQRIIMSCGEGTIDIFKQIDPNKYEPESKINTRAGARTSLFVPELNQLFVAAPAGSGNAAQLMIYQQK
jgi:YVTN family beta-propeller protein